MSELSGTYSPGLPDGVFNTFDRIRMSTPEVHFLGVQMDFSQYGHASQEWLDFVGQNPMANQDGRGTSINRVEMAGELRQKANKSRAATSEALMRRAGLVDKVAISTIQAPSRAAHMVPIRHYETTASPSIHTIIYLHGGGGLFGDEKTDDFACAKMAVETGALVLSIIYRHTHKYTHPAQTDDAWDAFEYVRTHKKHLGMPSSGHVTVMGISFGAGLAAGIILRDLQRSNANCSPLVTGTLLSMPWLIHPENYPDHLFKSIPASSKAQCADAPVIPAERMRLFWQLLGAQDTRDPLLNTALASDEVLRRWPRTAVIVTGMDPLRDDGLIFAERLEACGVATKVHVFSGLPHGFRRWPELKSSDVYGCTVLDHLSWLLGSNRKCSVE